MLKQELLEDKRSVNYSYGAYNKFDDLQQWVRLTEGCPHNCPYCYEPQEFKIFDMPEIVRNEVKIMDMNLIAKPEALEIINYLGSQKVDKKVVYYEAVCGIDYRFLTPEIAQALKEARFKPIRIAWDWGIKEQYKIKDAIKMLLDVGYSRHDLMVFMICNWKIPFETNIQKLDLLKVWGVRGADCYFDNQTSPNIQPIHWNEADIKYFRRKCRKHNQIVRFGIDPEVKQKEINKK